MTLKSLKRIMGQNPTNYMDENETNEVITLENDTETTEDVVVEVDVEALKKENETLKAQKDHWRKKAEIQVKKPVETVTPSEGLKVEDVLGFVSEGITHQDDVELAQKWIGFNKKPMNEAIKDPIFKAMLEQKREERKTSEATQIKGGPQGAKRVTGEDLLAKALQKGEYPQSEEDIDKMIKSKFDAKLKK